MSIENLKTFDPFLDAEEDNGQDTNHKPKAAKVHIRIQQRNGRKTLTTVQGLPYDYEACKDRLKLFKKLFSCNGTIIQDAEHGVIIQLQGDQRNGVFEWLTTCPPPKGPMLDKEIIQIHGF